MRFLISSLLIVLALAIWTAPAPAADRSINVAAAADLSSALPEVAGDAALLVNPEDTDELRRALAEVTGSEDLRRELSQRGLERAKSFRWEDAVRRTWELYGELLG